ncbi:MAG: hypothetical protein ACYDBH_20780 [Acidobacteriaceae bacterium]
MLGSPSCGIHNRVERVLNRFSRPSKPRGNIIQIVRADDRRQHRELPRGTQPRCLEQAELADDFVRNICRVPNLIDTGLTIGLAQKIKIGELDLSIV